MARKPRRAAARPRLEYLELRSLLSVAGLLPDTTPQARLLVRFQDNVPSPAAVLARDLPGAQILQTYPDGPVLVGVGMDAAKTASRLQADPRVRYAEPNATIHVDAIPNDPQFSKLWGLSNPNGIDVGAPAAWDIATGQPSVIVAVIDSGIDLTHPDLAGAIWTNPKPDGSDGYPGDVHGWNFITNTPDVQDDDGHGTHVAGTIGASGNNGTGVVGVAYGVTLMPLKFIGPDGNGSIDNAVQAIYFAVNHGARVINASWGGQGYSQALDDAIRYAGDHNVVFVTAAGNDGTNNDIIKSYPANERLPNVLSVAAIDQNGNLAGFSNYGRNTVDIAAPGVNIRSTVPGGYATYSGTSMATPFVAGVVALEAGLHPELSAAQLVDEVKATARPLPGLTGSSITGGIVDAAQALAFDPASQPITPPAHKKGRFRHIAHVRKRSIAPPRRPVHRKSLDSGDPSTFTDSQAVGMPHQHPGGPASHFAASHAHVAQGVTAHAHGLRVSLGRGRR